MIYLTTGPNGSGKTLFTLYDVQARALSEGRPVFHNGRFEPVPGSPLDSWQQFSVPEWESLPDGSILVVDEAQYDLGARRGPAPEWVTALSEHRRRGFDIYLITQHPLSIDVFVRRLIGPPGWHRHIKRVGGSELVTVSTWTYVNAECEKPTSRSDADVTTRAFPKEVFTWYKSASLHTAPRGLPRPVKVLGVVLVALAALIALGLYMLNTFVGRSSSAGAAARPQASASSAPPPARQAQAAPLSPAEFVKTFEPRVQALPWSAPRYDHLTQAVVAPVISGCVFSATRCSCYSQQGTVVPVDDATCRDLALRPAFNDLAVPVATAPAASASSSSAPVDASAEPPDFINARP